MLVFDNLSQVHPDVPTVMTIGVFDGIHRGHQALISTTVRRAHEIPDACSLVMTFDPHPREVLGRQTDIPHLTSLEERRDLIAALGVDCLVILPFTLELASLSAADFIAHLLRHVTLAELWVGTGFALGHEREGSVARLRELGRQHRFTVHTLGVVRIGAEVVSSTRIREALAAGAVETAARLLGRYPELRGTVVEGARRGRTLGFPTANLEIAPNRAVPANGVYATLAATADGPWLPSVTNVGNRPTFDNGARGVEVHLLGGEYALYGRELRVRFVARLRSEQRFSGPAELVAQIQDDVEAARGQLAHPPDPAANGVGSAEISSQE